MNNDNQIDESEFFTEEDMILMSEKAEEERVKLKELEQQLLEDFGNYSDTNF